MRQKRERILIVDDVQDNLQLLKHILKKDYEIARPSKCIRILLEWCWEKISTTRPGPCFLSRATSISQTILERIKAFDRGAGLVTPVIISSSE